MTDQNDAQSNLPVQDDVQADGYYGDDSMNADEIDLSFLDEDNNDAVTDKK